MNRASPSYGRRGRLTSANHGISHTASTYGKAKVGMLREKAGGHLIVESNAERFVAHFSAIDPRISASQPQPVCSDLIAQRLLLTR